MLDVLPGISKSLFELERLPLAVVIIVGSVWIMYFHASWRVKDTFVKSLTY